MSIPKRYPLLDLCSPCRPEISRPYEAEWNDDKWDVARAEDWMMLVRGSTWEPSYDAPSTKKAMASLSRSRHEIFVPDMTGYLSYKLEACDRCDGEGCAAGYCDRGFPWILGGIVGPVSFNRRLLRDLVLTSRLYHSSDDFMIKWSGIHDVIYIHPDEMDPSVMIVIMPRVNPEEEEVSVESWVAGTLPECR